jgi:cytochrome bd-type quinol oxidase subunit 2
MFSHPFYNVVHIVGIVLAMSALGATAIHALNGGTRQTNRARALVAALHGAGVLLILVGGFGMLARLGFRHGANFPGWLWVKLAVWTLVAALVVVPYRRPKLAAPVFVALPILGGVAAYMAIYKPI